MLKQDCPCIDCHKRNGACHDSCGDYLNWKTEYTEQQNTQIKRSINDNYWAERYSQLKAEKAKRKRSYMRYQRRKGM